MTRYTVDVFILQVALPVICWIIGLIGLIHFANVGHQIATAVLSACVLAMMLGTEQVAKFYLESRKWWYWSAAILMLYSGLIIYPNNHRVVATDTFATTTHGIFVASPFQSADVVPIEYDVNVTVPLDSAYGQAISASARHTFQLNRANGRLLEIIKTWPEPEQMLRDSLSNWLSDLIHSVDVQDNALIDQVGRQDTLMTENYAAIFKFAVCAVDVHLHQYADQMVQLHRWAIAYNFETKVNLRFDP